MNSLKNDKKGTITKTRDDVESGGGEGGGERKHMS